MGMALCNRGPLSAPKRDPDFANDLALPSTNRRFFSWSCSLNHTHVYHAEGARHYGVLHSWLDAVTLHEPYLAKNGRRRAEKGRVMLLMLPQGACPKSKGGRGRQPIGILGGLTMGRLESCGLEAEVNY